MGNLSLVVNATLSDRERVEAPTHAWKR